MAVQARHLSHSNAFSLSQDEGFPRFSSDVSGSACLILHALPHRAMEDAAVAGTVLCCDYGGYAPPAAPGTIGVTTTVLSDFPRGDVACDYGFEPRKRPRVAAGRFSEDQSVVMRPPPAGQVGDLQGRALGSGAASRSGKLNNGASVSQSQGILSRLYHQDVEIDALVKLEIERIRAALEEARRRHARELLAAVECAASGRARAAEAELERALRRNAELEEKARQVGAECHAWMSVARSHEAVAAGLRATLDQLLLQAPWSCAAAAVSVNEGAAAEDAQSCCFVAPVPDDADAAPNVAATASSSCRCKACGGGDACVLLLPCRHLCLCSSCDAAVDACPVCSAAKNASLHVLLC